MGAPRKYYRNKDVLFVTFSLEQGLLLLANPFSRCIIQGCLARAKAMYPVRLSHFIVNGNHIHLLLVVINPQDTANFIGYFKAEVAHRFNIAFGWKKRTVWCEGYDSPVVLTPVRALIAIAYLYANPAKDNLEDSIDTFPGLSSWESFRTGNFKQQWKHVRRTRFRELRPGEHNLTGYTTEATRLLNSSSEIYAFNLEPNAWLHAFGITEHSEIEQWNRLLEQRVRKLEARARRIRSKAKLPVIGCKQLTEARLNITHKANRKGRRMWCLSEKRSVRAVFIRALKELIAQARAIFKRWHLGDYSEPYPAGLFPPRQPKLFEPLPLY